MDHAEFISVYQWSDIQLSRSGGVTASHESLGQVYVFTVALLLKIANRSPRCDEEV
jgi:hypothetical protein